MVVFMVDTNIFFNIIPFNFEIFQKKNLSLSSFGQYYWWKLLMSYLIWHQDFLSPNLHWSQSAPHSQWVMLGVDKRLGECV